MGTKSDFTPERNQVIRFTNGVAFFFSMIMLIAAFLFIFLTDNTLLAAISLFIVLCTLIPSFFLNWSGLYKISRILLGYIFPLMCVIGTLVFLKNGDLSFRAPEYYAFQIFILTLLLIPLNLYVRRKTKYFINCIFILLLVVSISPSLSYLDIANEGNSTNEGSSVFITFTVLLGLAIIVLTEIRGHITEIYRSKYQELDDSLESSIDERVAEVKKSDHFLRQLQRIAFEDLELGHRIGAILKSLKEFYDLDLAIVSRIEGDSYQVFETIENQYDVKKDDIYSLKDTLCEITLKSSPSEPLYLTSIKNTKYNRHPAYRNLGLNSYIGVPIEINSHLFGTLNLSSSSDGRTSFTKTEIELFKEAARAIRSDIIIDQARKEKEKEQFFSRKLINSLPGIFYLYKRIGDHFRLIQWNRNHELVTGFSSEELYHKTPDHFFYPSEHKALSKAITNVVEKGKGNLEAKIKTKDGSTIPYHFEGFRFDLNDNLFFLGVGFDISKRVETEKELLLSEKRLKAAQRIAKVGDWELDLNNYVFVHWSEELFDIFGIEPNGEKITFEDLIEKVHPDDRTKAKSAFEYAIQSNSEIFNVKHRILKPNGDIVHLDVNAQNVRDKNGRLTRTVGTAADITQLKRIELALQESEAKLKNAQTIAHVGNWEYNVLSDINKWSDETYKIFELPIGSKVDYSVFRNHIHPDDIEMLEQTFYNSVEAKTAYRIEHRIITENGIKYVQQRGIHIFGDNDEHLRTVGTTQDITEMKLSEIALKNSESKFRNYLNNAPNGIFITNSDAFFLDLNPIMEEMTGYSENELRVMRFTHMDPDKEAISFAENNLQKLEEDGLVYFETSYLRSNGEKHYWSVNAVKLSDGNYLAFTQDITERIEKDIQIQDLAHDLELQNEKLEISLETGNLIAWEYKLEDHTISFYPEGKELDFFNIAKPFKGFDQMIKGVHPSQREFVKRKIQSHVDGRTNHFEMELMVRTQIPNTWKWIFVTGKIIKRSESGTPLLAYGIMQDIDWKKSIENILLQGQEMERKRVSTEIHDSIGQMLVGTRFLVQKSLRTDPSENALEIDEMLDQIIKETRMIINNLGISLFEEDTLKDAVAALVGKMERLTNANICLDWQGSSELKDPSVALNVFRILQEALSNAVKYAESSEIKIKVYNKEFFLMEIDDDGVGFKPEDFTEGFGIDNMRKRASSVEGKLDINSIVGKGTKVSLEV